MKAEVQNKVDQSMSKFSYTRVIMQFEITQDFPHASCVSVQLYTRTLGFGDNFTENTVSQRTILMS